jgi:hypothetical protein
MRWSSYYWNIICDSLSENQLHFDTLLMEARMSLATAALFNSDTTKALILYSLVNTPQSAWNQSQVCNKWIIVTIIINRMIQTHCTFSLCILTVGTAVLIKIGPSNYSAPFTE